MLRVIEYFGKSFKIIQNDTVEYGVCKSLLETMSISHTIFEIFNVEE